jgi:hypothetical protein
VSCIRKCETIMYSTSRQDTHNNMAHAHCMLDNQGYQHALRICSTYCISTATMVARTRLSTLPVLSVVTLARRGRDSSVGIATHFGLDSLGIESRWRRNFLPSSEPALVPTLLPVQWVSGIFLGGKSAGSWS